MASMIYGKNVLMLGLVYFLLVDVVLVFSCLFLWKYLVAKRMHPERSTLWHLWLMISLRQKIPKDMEFTEAEMLVLHAMMVPGCLAIWTYVGIHFTNLR